MRLILYFVQPQLFVPLGLLILLLLGLIMEANLARRSVLPQLFVNLILRLEELVWLVEGLFDIGNLDWTVIEAYPGLIYYFGHC